MPKEPDLVELSFDEALPDLEFDTPSSGIQHQNLTGQLFNVPPAAMRAFLQGRGYTAGALRPDEVPTFNELGAQAAANFAGRLPRSVAPIAGELLSRELQKSGTVVDAAIGTATSPLSVIPLVQGLSPVRAATQAAAQTAPAQAFARFLTRQRRGPIQFTKDLFTAPQKAKEAAKKTKFDIRQQTKQATRELSIRAAQKQGIVRQNAQAINQSYDDLGATLKKQITSTSDKEALKLQRELPKLFKRKSTEYGQKLQGLIKGKNISASADDVSLAVEDTLVQHGVMRYDETGKLIVSRAPRTPMEGKILEMYGNLKRSLSDNPGARVDVEDLIRTKQALKPNFGKAWNPDDAMQASLTEKVSDMLDDSVPGLAKLRQDFRPYLQWKKQAINEFQPFNTKFDTSKASSLISRSGTPELRPDEARLLAEMNRQLDRQVGKKVATLQQGGRRVTQRQQQLAGESQKQIARIRQDAANSIQKLRDKKDLTIKNIDEEVTAIVNKYKSLRTKVAIGGGIIASISLKQGLLKYFVRREVYSGVHGSY